MFFFLTIYSNLNQVFHKDSTVYLNILLIRNNTYRSRTLNFYGQYKVNMTIRLFISISLITNRYLTRPVPYCTVPCIWHLSNRAFFRWFPFTAGSHVGSYSALCQPPVPVPLGIRHPQGTASFSAFFDWKHFWNTVGKHVVTKMPTITWGKKLSLKT
jgi:hypothetical protein